MTDLTSPEAVRAVIANRDPVRRNLQITQSYHELTVAFDPFFGGADAVWCGFATYASRQAGRFIRNEEVPKRLRRFLGLERTSMLRRWLTPSGWLRRSAFLAYARCTVEDVSASIAEGNRIVYTKLAPLYADFLELARSHREPDPAALAGFLATLAADPTTGEALHRAFESYYAALFEGDPKLRAERVFLANALVGWHEQTRLQEAIDGALRAPIRTALEDPERRLLARYPVPLVVRKLIAFLFRLLFSPVIRRFEDDWLRLATEMLMTLALPSGKLRMGDDLPLLADGEMYPEPLRRLTLPEVEEVVRELDYTPGTTRGSGARDWTDLGDRMNYLVDFFRSWQRQRELLAPPYTPEQVAVIHGGGVPAGRL